MTSLNKLETRLTLTEQAHQSIKRYILAKSPTSDMRMTETFFAEQLGISKSPVREALNSLQSEGLLRIEPRRGAFVYQFSPKEISDLYNLREALETFAAATATITPEFADELKASVDRTEYLLQSNDKEAYIDEDIRFHEMIVKATGNDELARVHRNLQDKLWLCRLQTYTMSSSDTPSAHRAIAEALAAGDREAAQGRTRDHIRFVSRMLVEACERSVAASML